MADNEVRKETGDDVVSLDEYLAAEKDLEDDARAVLGGSDPHNCTYPQGYVCRQALYACSTCTPTDQEPAGVCLACSLECHDGHELFELYTKRRFRCDCGNKKFGDLRCKLYESKDDLNINNKYNQNFTGVYCTCARPYPDPDHEDDGEMIQCCVCEDWYHDNHLELSSPVPDEYKEMICIGCVKRHPFLLNYSDKLCASVVNVTPSAASASSADQSAASGDVTDSVLSVTEASQATPSDQPISQSSGCDKLNLSFLPASTLFVLEGWRDTLCKCSHCDERYKTDGIDFLTDPDDPTDVYEQKSKGEDEVAGGTYDRAMSAMNSLGRVQQVELIQGYNDMKSNLAEYLKKFAENGKVVRAEDIQEFFEEYKKNKRSRSGVPPSSCS